MMLKLLKQHKTSYEKFWKNLRTIVKKILLLSEGSGDPYKKLTRIEPIAEVLVHRIKYNTAKRTKTRYPLYIIFSSAYDHGEKITNYATRSQKARLLKASDPISKAVANISNFKKDNVLHYPTGKKNNKNYFIFIIGINVISIRFDFEPRTKNDKALAYFLMDTCQRALTSATINRTKMEQEIIVGLVRGIANDYLDRKRFQWIISGNAQLLHSTFGFTQIVFQLSDDLRILFNGKAGMSFDFDKPPADTAIAYTTEYLSSAYHINRKKYNEVIQLPLAADSQFTVMLYSPHYSRTYVRELLFLNTFMTTLKTIVENSFNILQHKRNARQTEKALRKKSETDYLTNMLNRNGFYHVVKKTKNNSDVLLAELDIDDFKVINDTYGHDAGDEVLLLMSKLMNDSFTRNTIFSRFGGEEFIIVIPNQTEKEALHMLYKFCDRIRNTSLAYYQKNKKITFTISCGAVYFNYNRRKQKTENYLKPFIQEADKALYYAKAHGKNAIYLFKKQGKFKKYSE
ncbi:MAG TPA: GGDEF domain-containing protein [Spirochaetota bacterium]|nr:GGDEF domain-containing protein [Spirochaetota bacterium]